MIEETVKEKIYEFIKKLLQLKKKLQNKRAI